MEYLSMRKREMRKLERSQRQDERTFSLEKKR
jgi:hypothetical protein